MLAERKAMSGHFQPEMRFDCGKSAVAVAYLVQKTGKSLYDVMKMLYVADKCHLERYGRFITGDRYVAMAKGPVPSATYDLMKYLRGERRYFDGGEPVKRMLKLERGGSHAFTLLQSPNLDALSESDIECLDYVAALMRKKGARHVRALSHDEAWRNTPENDTMAVTAIAASVEDGTALVQHLTDRFPGEAVGVPISGQRKRA